MLSPASTHRWKSANVRTPAAPESPSRTPSHHRTASQSRSAWTRAIRAVSTPITPMSRRRTLDHRRPRSLSSGMVITSQLTAAPARLMERRILTLSVMVNHVHQEVRWVDLCELQLVANLRRDMGKGGPFPMPIVGRRYVAAKLLKQQPAVRVLRVLGDEGQAAQPAAGLPCPLIAPHLANQINPARP